MLLALLFNSFQFNSIHVNILKRIFIIQLMIVSKMCKRLSKNINEMQNVVAVAVVVVHAAAASNAAAALG